MRLCGVELRSSQNQQLDLCVKAESSRAACLESKMGSAQSFAQLFKCRCKTHLKFTAYRKCFICSTVLICSASFWLTCSSIANTRWRINVCDITGMSRKSYGTKNIRTTVPCGFNNVAWTVPLRGIEYPRRDRRNSHWKDKKTS